MTRKRNTMKASELNGLFIYHDQKKGTIFYDIFTGRAFIITSSDVQKYLVYTSMLPISILLSFSVLSIFKTGFLFAILLFLVLFITTEIYFRITYFYRLPELENWKPQKKNLFAYLQENYSIRRLLLLVLMLLLLSGLIFLYANHMQMTGFNLYSSYLIAILCLAAALFILAAVLLKKKN